MRSLEYIRISKDKKLLLLGILEEGERSCCTVSESFYLSLGSPAVGDFVSDEELEAIKVEDVRIRATKKALSILSYADNSERSLVLKLVRAGFSRSVSENAAREMVALGYIDDERILRRLILNEANVNLAGFSKFLPKLVSKGYSAEKIKDVTAALVREGEIDFKTNAKRLIEKKLPSDASTEEKKTILYKNGYKI